MGSLLVGMLGAVAAFLVVFSEPKAAEPSAGTEVEVPDQYGISERYLPDGTRCITLYSNGISCDWDHPKKNMEKQ